MDLKKLLYRSTHRGCKEMDSILGEFAKHNLDALSEEELILYEKLLDVEDACIYDWVSGRLNPPDEHSNLLLSKIIDFANRKRYV